MPLIPPDSTPADMADFFRTMDAHHVPEKRSPAVTRIIVDGPDAVMLGQTSQTVKANGRAYTTPFALHLTVEDGPITRYHLYDDSLTVAEAVADR